ncbi:hypothetical protein FAM09_06455 [Niastella caeni]|uniref:PEGA domain-containing protein n=1 Tax=Niastella caeni TaxID=2569763 RepID=A0A4S8I126_9BACT|nr:hypothetical protein [Niastella caeni]THU41737.1 hypothetical protein FAM09_06455 [Niastella caeni]
MKTIFTLITVLFSITTFAAPGPKTSRLAISSNDRSVMQVKIDGVMYNLNSTFVMDNIRTGNHTITIYKTENMGFRKRTQVVYNSSMYIAPAQFINIDINRAGKVVIKTTNNKFDRNDNFRGNNRNNNNDRYDKNNNDRNRDGRDDRYGRY